MLPYSELLNNKRVCLVGPSSQTELMTLGEKIDSYDVICRVGSYAKLNHRELGSRTDILMENFWLFLPRYGVDKVGLYNNWVDEGVKHINTCWNHIDGLDEFRAINDRSIPIKLQDDEMYKKIRVEMDTPTKGFCALYELMQEPIKELFIVGFSFSNAFGYRKDRYESSFNIPKDPQNYISPEESVNNFGKFVIDAKHDDHKSINEFAWLKARKDNPILSFDPWLHKLLC